MLFLSCFTSKNLTTSLTIPCDNGFESVFSTAQFTSTVISEWQLVCANRWVGKWLTLLVMAGLLFGVFSFGPIIDRIGRKNTILVASIGLSVVQVLISKFEYINSYKMSLTIRLIHFCQPTEKIPERSMLSMHKIFAD